MFTHLTVLFMNAEPRQLIYYAVSAVLSLLVLLGISRMSKVEKAASGNLLGAGSMLAAILLTLWYFNIFSVVELWIAMLIGTVFGLYLSRKVAMIQMPQMVGLLNGFGGLASMLAGILTLTVQQGELNAFSTFTAALAIMVGGLTWSGSAVAAAKLHRLMNQKPIILPGHQVWTMVSLLLSSLGVIGFFLPAFAAGTPRTLLIIFTAIMSNLFGYIFAIRVGGADMPITISLLNSFSGVAGSIAGMAIGDLLLVAVGGIVGASGLLLTQIMCRSMNRHLMDILLGKTSAPSQAKPASAPQLETPSVATPTVTPAASAVQASPAVPVQKTAGEMLREAHEVIIVPGYGMALSQAQSQVKQLADELEGDGKRVRFAIHPVAGRMPGHMNVLLAEVDVPYDKLYEMESIDSDFATTDLVLVIGANDVVNPAANTAEGTPIYGMPVLSVDQAKHIIICNFDEQPGYAGVPNPLYAEAKTGGDHVSLKLGDAKESLGKLRDEYRKADTPCSCCQHGETSGATPATGPGQKLKSAQKIIIVPGYGMALSQAQPIVKQLTDELEADGKQVEFAIHPVAGRMPGHMNVLLAEVDVPYDKLHEMQEIDADFKNTDLVLVIGANDVINPAANTAEGTPIYGMPVLSVEDARHIIICNFDEQPGYAGVPNPLYAEAKTGGDHVTLLLGDAKESLKQLRDDYRSAPAGDLSTPAQGESLRADSAQGEANPGAWLKEAQRVIIVPGYGMALSQAQPLVKQLSDELEAAGKQVAFAIHPVAGRMPGHMNVLLAEVDVPYDKLKEMQEIDDEFKNTDVTVIIGANDVINPAANTAEGTPIYGMPVLSVADSKRVIICNFDRQPGYAGVDNPLYSEADQAGSKVLLLLGDAKESLQKILKSLI